jgi:TRAP transporter TAXI family solute receptor
MKTLYALLLPLICLGLAACERGPEADRLRAQIQQMLDTEFKAGLFEVLTLKRLGSAPSREQTTGDERLIVYFNTRLKFLEDYNLAAWEQLNIGSLSFLLGATEDGISGFHTGGNQQGDILQVHGTAHYALRSGDWQAVRFDSIGPEEQDHPKAPKVKRLLDALNATYEANSARLGGKEIAILEKELNQAARKINRQLDALENVFSMASGPEGGSYHVIAQALEDQLRHEKVRTNNYETEGSAENCRLVQHKAIDIAMAQNNVATMAYRGVDFFKPTGAMPDLRALASLYPELVHLVTPRDAGIQTLQDLKGRRIDIGLPNSGSRIDALKILQAAGLKLADFSAVSEQDLKSAIAALKKGELDAIFVTIEAPTPALQVLAATYPIRFVSLDMQRLQQDSDGLNAYMSMRMPANTYPRQSQGIATLGVSALLLAHQDLPDERVWDLLDAMMQSLDRLAEESVKAAFISRQTAQSGITIPLHPGAQAYFE